MFGVMETKTPSQCGRLLPRNLSSSLFCSFLVLEAIADSRCCSEGDPHQSLRRYTHAGSTMQW